MATAVAAALVPAAAMATDAGAGPGIFWTSGTSQSPGTHIGAQTASGDPVSGHWEVFDACAPGLGGDRTCSEVAHCPDGSVMTLAYFVATDGTASYGGTNCPQDAAAPPEVTPGLVLRALRRVPLPASELVVQPPGGRTLVNFETNFYTEQGEFARVVQLLGRRVELSIWPESFVWRYGDGSSERTSSAGAPYPDLEITHRYLERGRVAVSVDTTYAAEFRVDGGPWRPVVGTVTIPGESESLRVVTARPVLVGG